MYLLGSAKKIRLGRIILPVISLSVSLLVLVHSLFTLMGNVQFFFHAESESHRSIRTPHSETGVKISLHGPSLDPALSYEDDMFQRPTKQTGFIITFFVEMFSALTTFIAASLYLLTSLLGLLWNMDTFPEGFTIPFPRKQVTTRNAPMINYLEFACFLSAVTATFGAVMMITTIGIQYGVEIVESGRNFYNPNDTSSQMDQFQHKIQQICGAVYAVLSLLLNFTTLFYTMNFCALCRRAFFENRQKTGSTQATIKSPNEIISLLTAVVWLCLRLARIILSLSSVLITSGGLIALGSFLQLIETEQFSSVFQLKPCQSVEIFIGVFCGVAAILAGVFSVTAVQCCSTPLEVLLTRETTMKSFNQKRPQRFSRLCYLSALVLCLLVLPLAFGTHIMIRLRFATALPFTPMCLDSCTDALVSKNLARMGYTLCFVFDLTAFLTAAALLTSLLMDLIFRVKFLQSVFSTSYPISSLWNEAQRPVRVMSADTICQGPFRQRTDYQPLAMLMNVQGSKSNRETWPLVSLNSLDCCKPVSGAPEAVIDLNVTGRFVEMQSLEVSTNEWNSTPPPHANETFTANPIGCTANARYCKTSVPIYFASVNNHPGDNLLPAEPDGTVRLPLESQLVYTCADMSPSHRDNYNGTSNNRVISAQVPENAEFEACEYMSCDITSAFSTNNPENFIPFRLTSEEKTPGEDYITSV